MMKPFKALFALALAALFITSAQAAGASAARSVQGSATISSPGGRDFSGFLIVVAPNGRAFALDGAGHASGLLQLGLTQTLFADLAAAGPLAALPERTCDGAIIIGWNGQRSSNLSCSSDPRAVKLLADVKTIQRAMYVQSYRMSGRITASAASGPYTRGSMSGGYAGAGYVGGSSSTVSAGSPPSYPAPAAGVSSSEPARQVFTTSSSFGVSGVSSAGNLSGMNFNGQFATALFTPDSSLGGRFNNGGSFRDSGLFNSGTINSSAAFRLDTSLSNIRTNQTPGGTQSSSAFNNGSSELHGGQLGAGLSQY